MKTIKTIYKWILISVLIQVVILSYVNFSFLGSKRTIEVTNYDIAGTSSDLDIKIPENAEQIQGSYNCSLVGLISEGKLDVIDTKTNKEVKVISDDEGSISYYRWLPDRNMVIYSAIVGSNGKSIVKLGTYDFDSDIEKKDLKIKNQPENSIVTAIELSPLTNIIYVKIKISDEEARVYKFDIMDNLSYIMNIGSDKDIKETNYTDSFIYQTSEKKLFIRQGRKNTTKQIGLFGKLSLLGVDLTDKLYVGALDSQGMVQKIYIGKPGENQSYTFDTISLKKAVPKENLAVTNDGRIFFIEREAHKVSGVGNNCELIYKGTFIEINNKNVLSVDKGILRIRLVS